MPTMTSKKLSDLESERESFLLHEQRIIQERAEILKNVRNHLNQLNTEILRLGGTARNAANQGHNSSPAAASNAALASGDGGFIPSIAPFPSVTSDSQQGKKPRGRPRKQGEGSEAKGGQGGTEKKRGKPKKEKVVLEMENAPSNASPNDDASSSSNNPKKKRSRPTKNDTAADLIQAGDGKTSSSKEGKKRKTAATSNDNHTGEPWTCECGQNMAAGRARCGKCRRWKGGKRQKRWSNKKSDDSDTAAASSGKHKAKARKKNAVPKAIDVYRNLPPAQLKSAQEAVVVANEAAKDPRSEIEAIMGQMVSSVTSVADLGQSKKAKVPKKKGENATSNKRKRGRPRKESDNAQREPIQRVVSTSDSDNGSATDAPRQRGRPRKHTVVEQQKVPSDADAEQTLKQSHLRAEGTKSIAAKQNTSGGAKLNRMLRCVGIEGVAGASISLEREREQIASDCLQYFYQVRNAFADSSQVYKNLIQVVSEFRSEEVETVDLICRLMTLLDGHNGLILGVNDCLPEKYKIETKDLDSHSN
mmetsp:Transcript_32593/g.68517  ORF Transcript_32593/g.68517 Transcript_32593/m.68517 type:complete len:532 (+) Transcript_32593:225-1820(+)